MNRSEALSKIHNRFDVCANEFCKQTNGFGCDIYSQYKGEEKSENLNYRTARIRYGSFTIRFVYTAHGLMNVINSVISCDIALDVCENAVFIPLPLMTDYCDKSISTPMCIPLISNENGVIQAFNCIGTVLKNMLNELYILSNNTELKTSTLGLFEDELKLCMDIDNALSNNNIRTEAKYLSFVANYFVYRFSSSIFVNAIKGNYKKAIKQLNKVKRKTGYEDRLLSIWQKGTQPKESSIPEVVANANHYNNNGVQKTSFKDFVSIALGWMVLCPVLSALYACVFYVLLMIEKADSVYLAGVVYYFPYCVLMGFITAIAASYFTRIAIYKLVFKGKANKALELDYIQNGTGSDKLMKGFLVVLIAASLVACILLANHNVNFFDNGFEDNTRFFSTNGTYHSYQELEKVYYKPNRVNGFGETLDSPSYVLVLKNGKEIDLYEYDDIKNYEQIVIPLLESKGVRIERQTDTTN